MEAVQHSRDAICVRYSLRLSEKASKSQPMQFIIKSLRATSKNLSICIRLLHGCWFGFIKGCRKLIREALILNLFKKIRFTSKFYAIIVASLYSNTLAVASRHQSGYISAGIPQVKLTACALHPCRTSMAAAPDP